jgi:2-methylcitrate dehydratase PrpD
MIIEPWAERLLHAPSSPEIVELHLKDAVTAFVSGLRTTEGEALARFYGSRRDAAELAAAAAGTARLSESDDIHLGSCVTPGAVVIPVALALAGTHSAEDFNRAIAAGYSAGLTLGVAIGGAKALEKGVWPTLLAAPLMAAVTASSMRGHNTAKLSHAMALSLGGTSGRLGRPSGTPSGRWFAFAEAVLKGLRASQAADRGFRADPALLSASWLGAQAGHDEIQLSVFETSPMIPAISDTGFKPFPIARQGANAVMAFQQILAHGLDRDHVESIEVFVPALNVAILSRPASAEDRLSRISSIGYQLACAAFAPDTLYDAERPMRPAMSIAEFAARVLVKPTSEFNGDLPIRWPARVMARANGRSFEETIVRAPFDADGEGLSALLTEKWRRVMGHDALETTGTSYAMIWRQIAERLVAHAG